MDADDAINTMITVLPIFAMKLKEYREPPEKLRDGVSMCGDCIPVQYGDGTVYPYAIILTGRSLGAVKEIAERMMAEARK